MNLKQLFGRHAAVLAVAGGALTTLPSCTDTQIAASAAVAAGAIICNGFRCADYDRYDRYGRRDRWDRDRWDRGDRRGRGGRHGGGMHFAATTDGFKSTDSRVIGTADKYGISHYAATYIVRAVSLARAKDTSGIRDLGLTVDDFKDIYEGRTLPNGKVSTLGSKLRLNHDDAATLVREMRDDVQVAKAARGL